MATSPAFVLGPPTVLSRLDLRVSISSTYEAPRASPAFGDGRVAGRRLGSRPEREPRRKRTRCADEAGRRVRPRARRGGRGRGRRGPARGNRDLGGRGQERQDVGSGATRLGGNPAPCHAEPSTWRRRPNLSAAQRPRLWTDVSPRRAFAGAGGSLPVHRPRRRLARVLTRAKAGAGAVGVATGIRSESARRPPTDVQHRKHLCKPPPAPAHLAVILLEQNAAAVPAGLPLPRPPFPPEPGPAGWQQRAR